MTRKKRAKKSLLSVPALAALMVLVGLGYWLFPKMGELASSVPALKLGVNPVLLTQLRGDLEGGQGGKMSHLSITPYTGYGAPPDLDETSTYHGIRYHYKTNRFGFLSKYDLQPFEEGGYPKEPNEKTVLLTGSSLAWGEGATSNETSISYQMEAMLNSADPAHRWKVHNLANLGWMAYQEFIALDLYGAEMNPDWIVTIDGRADIVAFTAHGEPIPGYFLYEGQRRLNSLFDSEESPKSGLAWNNPFARAVKLFTKINEMTRTPAADYSDATLGKALRFYFHAKESMLRDFPSARFVMAMAPTQEYDISDNIVQKGYQKMIAWGNDSMKKHPNMEFFNSMDLYPRPLDPYFIDGGHLSDQGQMILAKNLVQRILAREQQQPKSVAQKSK